MLRQCLASAKVAESGSEDHEATVRWQHGTAGTGQYSVDPGVADSSLFVDRLDRDLVLLERASSLCRRVGAGFAENLAVTLTIILDVAG